jgi:hypothetical protein
MLEARDYPIWTDRNPLTFAINRKRDKCSLRQFNHMEFV